MKIPIRRHVDDPTLPWEERYRRLEAHHLEETAWLIGEVRRLEELVRAYEAAAGEPAPAAPPGWPPPLPEGV
jgi:hypothetical protein